MCKSSNLKIKMQKTAILCKNTRNSTSVRIHSMSVRLNCRKSTNKNSVLQFLARLRRGTNSINRLKLCKRKYLTCKRQRFVSRLLPKTLRSIYQTHISNFRVNYTRQVQKIKIYRAKLSHKATRFRL
jgi:hypothetical protein